MKLEIVTNGETTEVDLEPGVVTVGGTDTDGIQIAGLGAGALELHVERDRLLVKARDVFTVDEVLSPPGVKRLVLPDERIALNDQVVLRVVPQKAPAEAVGTVAVLRQLMGDLGDPEEANCASLTCLTGLDVGRRYPIAGDVLELGRGDAVQIRIRDRAVSRRHAKLRKAGAGYTIEDLKTPNGIFINGKEARGPTPLSDGAIIELGQSLLRFRGPVEPPPHPPPEPPEPPKAEASEDAAKPDGGVAGGEQPAAPAVSAPRARSFRVELALIGVGVTLALLGMLVTFGLVAGN